MNKRTEITKTLNF